MLSCRVTVPSVADAHHNHQSRGGRRLVATPDSRLGPEPPGAAAASLSQHEIVARPRGGTNGIRMVLLSITIGLLFCIPFVENALGGPRTDRVPIDWGSSPVSKKIVLVNYKTGDGKIMDNFLGSLNRLGGCVGAVVGPTAVITAAHCIYDDGEWHNIDSIETFDGFKFDVVDVYVPQEFRKSGGVNQKRDVGIIYTDKIISTRTSGVVRLEIRPEITLKLKGNNRFGIFAFKKNDDIMNGNRDHVLFFQACSESKIGSFVQMAEEFIVVKCYSEFGDSGAPVFLVNKGAEKLFNDRFVNMVGVLTNSLKTGKWGEAAAITNLSLVSHRFILKERIKKNKRYKRSGKGYRCWPGSRCATVCKKIDEEERCFNRRGEVQRDR